MVVSTPAARAAFQGVLPYLYSQHWSALLYALVPMQPDIRFVTAMPADVSTIVARVHRISGANRNIHVDRPVVDIDVFGPSTDVGNVSAAARNIAASFPHGDAPPRYTARIAIAAPDHYRAIPAPLGTAQRTKSRSIHSNDTATPQPTKDNELLYAAGDVIVWVGPPNTGCPKGFEDITTIGDYACAGWVDTSGYIFKLDETLKDIPAAGILTPIRSILTGGTKSVQATLLEGLNPIARSLYDDVPIFPLTTSPLKPGAGPPANIASYIIPDPPEDNRYSVIWDSIDGDKAMRLYSPFAGVLPA